MILLMGESEKGLPVLKKMGYSFQQEIVLAALSQWHLC